MGLARLGISPQVMCLCFLNRGWRQDGQQPGQEEHPGKGAEGQWLICGMYFCTMDIAFHLSTCQLPLAPALAPNLVLAKG